VYCVDPFEFDAPVAEDQTIGGRVLSLTVNDRLSGKSRDGDIRVVGIGRRSSPKDLAVIVIRCSSIELSVRPVIFQHDWRIYSVM